MWGRGARATAGAAPCLRGGRAPGRPPGGPPARKHTNPSRYAFPCAQAACSPHTTSMQGLGLGRGVGSSQAGTQGKAWASARLGPKRGPGPSQALAQGRPGPSRQLAICSASSSFFCNFRAGNSGRWCRIRFHLIFYRVNPLNKILSATSFLSREVGN